MTILLTFAVAAVATGLFVSTVRMFAGKKPAEVDECRVCGRAVAGDEGTCMCGARYVRGPDGQLRGVSYGVQSDEPFNCPRCSGRIELVGDVYECRGVATQEEADRLLAYAWDGRVPRLTGPIKACGWKGEASEFGKSWG